MMSKLIRSELDQRTAELGCELLATAARLAPGDALAPNRGDWPRGFMNSFGFTIGGGTSEIQRNLIAERVLDLPKSR
jgi:alkylation response protein AidB-like acyl-CoA dehydrogenase